jgi:hypothetical protein
MDWPSLWSLGTNNVLVGTSIHCMSASAVQTAHTAGAHKHAIRELAVRAEQTGGFAEGEIVEPAHTDPDETPALRRRMVGPCEENPAGLTTEPLLRWEG